MNSILEKSKTYRIQLKPTHKMLNDYGEKHGWAVDGQIDLFLSENIRELSGYRRLDRAPRMGLEKIINIDL
jgi:hypothetical protein